MASVALGAPQGIFSAFAQCPTSLPGVTICQHIEVTAGELQIGSLQVPVAQPVVLQGGGVPTGGANLNEYFVVPAANGESVSPVELEVPGGLRSIVDCYDIKDDRGFSSWLRRHACRTLLRGPANRLSATIEAAGSPSSPSILNLAAAIEEKGQVLLFPIKLHLKNELLGEGCYIGSEASPIELRLTDGTTNPPAPNEPITGTLGAPASEFENGYELTTLTGDTLVDNSFSTPPAEGCTEHHIPILDHLISQALNHESPAGHNTAILTGTHKITEAQAVLASEHFPPTTPLPEEEPPHHHHHHHYPEAH
jgi:hypothetical protein